MVAESLEALGRAARPGHAVVRLNDEPLWLLSSTVLFLSGLLAVACLRRPTYRRSFALLGQILQERGRNDLHEDALRLPGFDRISHELAEAHLANCAIAFDKAVAVVDRRVPFGNSLRPHVRPYIINGAREMIDEGHHREAMFWIASYLLICVNAITMCAADVETARFRVMVDSLVHNVGLTSPEVVRSRYDAARHLVGELFHIAEDIVECLPENDEALPEMERHRHPTT